MTPNPSQPNINLIRLGLRISINIDATKDRTIQINRPKNCSDDIYEVLKIITLPATSLTKLIKYKDIKSKIITKLIVADPSDITSHSIINSSKVRNILAM